MDVEDITPVVVGADSGHEHQPISVEMSRRKGQPLCNLPPIGVICTVASEAHSILHAPHVKGSPQPESSTTVPTSTFQNDPSPSQSQATTTGTSTGTEPPSGKSSASSSGFSSDDGANTGDSTAPDALSTVISTSTVVFSTDFPPPTLPPNVSHSPPDSPSNSHRQPSIGTIVGITVAVFIAIFGIVLALFRLLRRMRRRTRCRSIESARQHLKPHLYDDRTSRRISSVWTLFGSVSVDPNFEPHPKYRPRSPDFPFAEKAAGPGPLDAHTTTPSPPTETQHFVRDISSVRSLPEGLSPSSGRSSSTLKVLSSAELLALAPTDYGIATRSNTGDGAPRRMGSDASRTTASSGEVQNVEAV